MPRGFYGVSPARMKVGADLKDCTFFGSVRPGTKFQTFRSDPNRPQGPGRATVNAFRKEKFMPLTVHQAEAEARWRWGGLFARGFARHEATLRRPFQVGTRSFGEGHGPGRGDLVGKRLPERRLADQRSSVEVADPSRPASSRFPRLPGSAAPPPPTRGTSPRGVASASPPLPAREPGEPGGENEGEHQDRGAEADADALDEVPVGGERGWPPGSRRRRGRSAGRDRSRRRRRAGSRRR